MVKVMITGGSGLLGRYLINTAPDDVELSATYLNHDVSGQCKRDVKWIQTDLCGPLQHLQEADTIIHTAAIGSVDYCENNKRQAHATNYIGTCKIARDASMYNTKVIFISTNAVYSGDEPLYTPHREHKPVNHYGELKSHAEGCIKNYISYENWTIIRPIMLYGWSWENSSRKSWAENFIGNMHNSFQKSFTHKGDDHSVRVVDDVITQPTYAHDLAQFIWNGVVSNRVGEYNFATCYPRSMYHFALEVASVFELNPYTVARAKLADFPNIAPRPKDTTYDLDELQKMYDYMHATPMHGLTRMRNERH